MSFLSDRWKNREAKKLSPSESAKDLWGQISLSPDQHLPGAVGASTPRESGLRTTWMWITQVQGLCSPKIWWQNTSTKKESYIYAGQSAGHFQGQLVKDLTKYALGKYHPQRVYLRGVHNKWGEKGKIHTSPPTTVSCLRFSFVPLSLCSLSFACHLSWCYGMITYSIKPPLPHTQGRKELSSFLYLPGSI